MTVFVTTRKNSGFGWIHSHHTRKGHVYERVRNLFAGVGRLTHDADYGIKTIFLSVLVICVFMIAFRFACLCACVVNTCECVRACVYVRVRLSVCVHLAAKARTMRKSSTFPHRRPFACCTSGNFIGPPRFPRLWSHLEIDWFRYFFMRLTTFGIGTIGLV